MMVSLSLSALAFTACGPSIDPAAKADIDRRIAALAPGTHAFPAPTAFAPRPFVVGQWTQYKLTDGNGQPSFMTTKIVGADGDAFWIESARDSYVGKTVSKMLVFIGDRMNPQSIDIRAVRMRDKNGRVTDVDPQVLQFMKASFQGAVSMLVISWQGQPQEDVVVPAGAFAGCFKMQTDASWGPWHAASLSWSHPAVPISGVVRSQGIDRPTTMELVAFGDSGATSELP
ncbi:MAG TPA: hypothetical protein VIK30_04525 [Polyangia bacterium]